MTVGSRSFTEVQFGTADETVVVPVPDSRGHGRVSVYGRLTGAAGSATLTVYGSFASTSVNEIQTLDFGNIGAADTFKLTFNGNETVAVTYSADMTADILAALEGIVDFVPGDVSVAKVSTSVYTVTFGGAFASTDVSAITITSVVGFVATGVTETLKGSSLPDLTDDATLVNTLVEVVIAQDNVFPYLVLVYDGDADPDLSATAYITTY